MKTNYYWIFYQTDKNIYDKSAIKAQNKADAIAKFHTIHPEYRTMGAKLIPKENVISGKTSEIK